MPDVWGALDARWSPRKSGRAHPSSLMIDEPTTPAPVNRVAVVSLLAGLLTLFSFCAAVAPIPLTEWLCFPSAAILGMLALVSGIAALAQIKGRNESGRAYALVGISVGGLAVLASTCTVALGILVIPKAVALVHHYISLVVPRIIALVHHYVKR
jgi:hypothetical protein